MKRRINLFALLLFAIAMCSLVSCKKVLNNPNTGGGGGTGTAKDLLYDSLYYYAQQTYYWNTSLPSYATFNPRQYENANDSLGLAKEQYAYTRIPIYSVTGEPYEQLIQYNPTTGVPVPDNSAPKYSQIYYTSNSFVGNTDYAPFSQSPITKADYTLNGQDSSFGFVVGFVPASYTYDSSTAKNQDSTVGLIRYVITGSPADKVGLRRGDVILKYNGQALNYDNNLSAIESALNGSSIQLTVYDPYKQDTVVMPTIQYSSYTFNPIFKSEVLTYGSHKIAYLAFLTFSTPTNAQPVLDSAFQSYANQGATDIVVDLRYNGGGYVASAEDLINYIAPSSANGKTMYTAYYNQMMVNGQATILKNVLLDYSDPSQGNAYNGNNNKIIDYSPSAQTEQITKAGNLNNLTKVYFIVSSGTASAAELVINSLKPYTTVTQLNADFSDSSSFTYGKPVGFFEIRIGQFSEWTPNFEMKNANGIGGYYQGLQSSYNGQPFKDFDDIMHDLGDPKEFCLSDMIYIISGVNTYANSSSTKPNQRSLNSMVMKAKSVGNVYRVSNMIGKPKRVFK